MKNKSKWILDMLDENPELIDAYIAALDQDDLIADLIKDGVIKLRKIPKQLYLTQLL